MGTYLGLITSTEDAYTFLHRTSKSKIEEILEKGLDTNANILTVATLQPKELGLAHKYYMEGKSLGEACVVIQIPREIWASARDSGYKDDEVMSPVIGTPNLKNGKFTLNPRYIIGWIDAETNAVYRKQA